MKHRIPLHRTNLLIATRNKMENKLTHTVRTVTNSTEKNIIETESISIHLTHINDCSPSWLEIGTTVKCGGAKLAL